MNGLIYDELRDESLSYTFLPILFSNKSQMHKQLPYLGFQQLKQLNLILYVFLNLLGFQYLVEYKNWWRV